ncbi:MAG: hypothetical protein ACLUTU_16245 [Blautia faecis]
MFHECLDYLQYGAARKLIDDFCLPIEIKGNEELSAKEKEHIRREKGRAQQNHTD